MQHTRQADERSGQAPRRARTGVEIKHTFTSLPSMCWGWLNTLLSVVFLLDLGFLQQLLGTEKTAAKTEEAEEAVDGRSIWRPPIRGTSGGHREQGEHLCWRLFQFISIKHSCSYINIWFAVSTVHNAGFAGEDPGQRGGDKGPLGDHPCLSNRR